MASAQFVRCYLIQTYKFLDLTQYAAGTERMPFQGRMLMMYPLRWAEHSALVHRWTGGAGSLFNSPENLVVGVVGFASVLIAGVMVTLLYRRISPTRAFEWLPFALLLVFLASNYLLHAPLVILYPYDLPSVAFFTAGVYLIYTRRFWALLVMFVPACFNRETVLFLIPLFVVDAVIGGDWKRLNKGLLAVRAGAFCVVWLAVHLYIADRFKGNHGEFYPNNWNPTATHINLNLIYLSQPKFWSQFDNACCYMLPFVILLRRYIFPMRVRAYVVVLPLWVATMVVFGLWPETRIYGELSGLVAVLCTLMLEGYASQRLVRPAERVPLPTSP
jgi:hypothetical protein